MTGPLLLLLTQGMLASLDYAVDELGEQCRDFTLAVHGVASWLLLSIAHIALKSLYSLRGLQLRKPCAWLRTMRAQHLGLKVPVPCTFRTNLF